MDRWRTDGRTVLVSALIFVATFAAFWPVFQNGFVHFDDPDYLIDNPHVQGGITAESLAWAFSSGHAANWHPITWVSHMLDCAMFGLNPAGHHFINLLIHAINGVLLLLALRKLTGAFWPSAFVAALFALHPLRVESVAWASERKDVLSGFFFFLTLLAYAAYAKQRGAGSDSSPPREPGTKAPNARTLPSYIAALVFFALGLMSKPMLVTVPFLLLLLDYWPLQRIRGWDPRAATRLLVEKAPFLVLAIVSSFITVVVQEKAVAGLGLPLESKAANALISYWQYILKVVWPINLSIFYPHPASVNPALLSWITWKSVLSILLVCAITAGAAKFRKTFPFFFTGWFWFLGMMVPVIGIVQVGAQAMADRYTYLPIIGLTIAGTWALKDRLVRFPFQLVSTAAVCLLVLLAGVTHWQAGFWRDDITIFSRAVSVTKDNAVAHQNLGAALELKGELQQAVEHYRASASIEKSAEIYFNLGSALLKQEKADEAITAFFEGLKLSPDDYRGNKQLGLALMSVQRYAEAIEPLRKVATARPSDAQAMFVVANALFEAGRQEDAREYYKATVALDGALYSNLIDQAQKLVDAGVADLAEVRLQQATRLKPDGLEAYKALGMLQVRNGKLAESIRSLEMAANLQPSAENHYNLGLVLFMAGQHSKAVTSYKAAVAVDPDYAPAVNNLAWLLATHPDASLRDGQEALRLASRNAQAHPDQSAYCGTLDAALAELGRWQEAVETAERTRSLAEKAGQKELAAAAQQRLGLYGKHEPYRITIERAN